MESLLQDSAPDFNDPVGLLLACHKRILGHCELLEKLAAHVMEHGVDDEARKAAMQVHRYFSTAGMLHHMDEEKDVFPLLVRQSLKMADIIHSLKKDHQKMQDAWSALAPLLSRPQTIIDHPQFPGMADEFCRLYRDHIRIEEREFFSRAVHMLSSDQLKSIGKSMKDRRKPAPESY